MKKILIILLIFFFPQTIFAEDDFSFFGSMEKDAIYLGTDISEKWLRDSLFEWSANAWDKESAWSFSPGDREIYFSSDYKFAWFDEVLDTWMGPCRGSGVPKED